MSSPPVVALLLAFLLSLAPPPDDSTQSAGPPVLTAQPTSSTITVDGRLNESDWSSAPTASGFRQFAPREGAEPSQRTTVRVLYGEDALYVGAMLHDEHPERIRARLTRRDQRNRADWFEVSIDSYYDQKTARTFAVNAAGVQRDGVVQGSGNVDASWDGIWRSEVRIVDRGWVAELRIPYSMLRFSGAKRQTWGLQFRRRIPRNSEVVEWPLVPQSERQSGLVAQYARLVNLQDLSAARNLQVAPYTLSRVQTHEDPDAPGSREVVSTFDTGADIELGLSSNATLNATVNPDFGQVESDPAVLNLSAFETFFPEKRPFFVQGTNVFDFGLGGGGRLLYTRRIGADAPLIGAAKVTGRSQDGLAYGVLGATTGDRFDPSRTYAAGRLQQDVGVQSTVGGMVTAYDGPSASGRRRSTTGGVDWDLRFLDRSHRFKGYLSSTYRRLTTEDQSSTTGFAMATEVGRVQGNWTYDLGLRLLTDTFNPNDIGRLRRNNFFRTSGSIRHQVNGGQPIGPFQEANGFLFVGQSWSYQNRLSRGLGFFSRFRALTDGFQRLSLSFNGDKLFGGYNLFETRGLWPRARPRTFNAEVEATTDTRRSWTVEVELGGGVRSDGRTALSGELETEWNVSDRIKLSGEFSYETERNAVEWASNETFVRQENGQWSIGPSNTKPSTLKSTDFTPLPAGHGRLSTILATVPSVGNGSYYVPVYGERDTDRLNLTLRSNLTLTPDLSIELFGQLFGARGRYRNFRILSSRDDFDGFAAYPKRHDFATSSFLSNTVLRWEFRPGSELFVVWSQNRSLNRDDPFFFDQRPRSPYDRSPTTRLTDAFGDFPENSFTVKLRYLFI